jgi:predicted RNA-binding protein with TRAM domain
MKKIFFCLLIITLGYNSYAQTNTFPTTGNVGIGTTTPATPLHVIGGLPMSGGWNKTATLKATFPVLIFNSNDAKWAGIGYDYSTNLNIWVNGSSDNLNGTAIQALSISNAGNISLGNGSSGSKLDVNAEANFTKFLHLKSDNQELQFYRSGAVYGYLWSSLEGLHWGKGSSSTGINIDNNGNTGIGTAVTKGYKLAVAGSMVAESVTVKLQSTWPDYVFTKDYQLPSLKETEQYIKDKGHLPGIPSAEEVKTNGVNLGEMNAKLLKKIEELTLILIQLNEKVEQQSETLEKQQKQLDKVKFN